MVFENVLKTLSTFPPKLSELLTPAEDIENRIEGAISSATGISLPPGPVKVAKNIMSNIESNVATAARALPISFKAKTPTVKTVPVKVEVVSTPSLGQAQVTEVARAAKPLRSEFQMYEA